MFYSMFQSFLYTGKQKKTTVFRKKMLAGEKNQANCLDRFGAGFHKKNMATKKGVVLLLQPEHTTSCRVKILCSCRGNPSDSPLMCRARRVFFADCLVFLLFFSFIVFVFVFGDNIHMEKIFSFLQHSTVYTVYSKTLKKLWNKKSSKLGGRIWNQKIGPAPTFSRAFWGSRSIQVMVDEAVDKGGRKRGGGISISRNWR